MKSSIYGLAAMMRSHRRCWRPSCWTTSLSWSTCAPGRRTAGGFLAVRVASVAALLVMVNASYLSPLSRFHDLLVTSSRHDFGSDEKAFLAAVEWQHARLARAGKVNYAEGASRSAWERAIGDSGDVNGSQGFENMVIAAGLGIFVAMAEHSKAREARELLATTFSPECVITFAHNRRHGAGFLVHASAAEVDVLLTSNGGPADVLQALFALPPNLKMAPSLFEYMNGDDEIGSDRVAFEATGGVAPDSGHDISGDSEEKAGPFGEGPDQDGDAYATTTDSYTEGLTSRPGKALHEEGLVVFLSPGAVPASGEEDVADLWRREWGSRDLNLHSLSFWSSSQAKDIVTASTAGMSPQEIEVARWARSEQPSGPAPASEGNGEPLTEEVDGRNVDRTEATMTGAEAKIGAATLVREWEGAASIVHSLASRGDIAPGEACGWDMVRVASESPGLITVRGIGHLLASASASSSSPLKLSGQERTSCLMGLVSFLVSRSETARISALPRAETFNAVASCIVQSGTENSTKLWDYGLDGTGQVIQVVDSGLGEGSCFFKDDGDGYPVEHGYLLDADGRLGDGNYTYDLSKRKVVQYIEGVRGKEGYVDDDALGHGSHVAGSAAGAISSDWEGPAECPQGVDGAAPEQTAQSCVGSCMKPYTLSLMPENAFFDLDAFCPEYDCDTYWQEYCLSNDRTETLSEASGVARGAKIAVLDLGGSEGLQQVLGGVMWETSLEAGARLHSGSWGFPDDPCTVDEASVSFDRWAYENPGHLLIFAAGNMGDDMVGCSIASPAVGKNCLAVGSSMSGSSRLAGGNIDETSNFSSRGPTLDGRIKPDVLAPGHFVFSAGNGGDGSCELQMNSGTSMSCPIAAGAAALIRQFFADGYHAADVDARGMCQSTARGTVVSEDDDDDVDDDDDYGGGSGEEAEVEFACTPFEPTGVLVKAMLIHSANAMGGSSDPDGMRGFGRIQLDAVVSVGGDGLRGLYVEDRSSSSTATRGQVASLSVEERSFYVSQEDVSAMGDEGGAGFRATLVWADPPATAFSRTQLVHDLDLYVEGPDGTLYTMLGVCTGDEDSCPLDDSNNAERVVVGASDVTAGTWKVRVSATNGLIEEDTQSFALVVTFPLSAVLAGSNGGIADEDGNSTGADGVSSTSLGVTIEETPAPTDSVAFDDIATASPTNTDGIEGPLGPGASRTAPPSSVATVSPTTDVPVAAPTHAPMVTLMTVPPSPLYLVATNDPLATTVPDATPMPFLERDASRSPVQGTPPPTTGATAGGPHSAAEEQGLTPAPTILTQETLPESTSGSSTMSWRLHRTTPQAAIGAGRFALVLFAWMSHAVIGRWCSALLLG